VPGSVSLEREFDKVSDHWLAPHNPSHLHIIVELPPDQRPFSTPSLSQSFRQITSDTSLRSNTVSILYEKLKKYHFILVRGTPASGKTTLAQLLAKHIRQQEPAVHVIPVYGWPLGEVNWQAHLLKHGWRQDKKTIFIFDEAQLSFEDFILWGEFFKELHNFDTPFAIAFASYGSPTTRFTIRGRPMFVGDLQRVALRAVDHGDDLGAVGLLFSRMEFDDLVRKRFSSSEYYFHQSFLDAVFRHTGGHVGAIDDFVRIVASDDSYRELKGSGRLYTWESFLKQVNLRDFFTRLETRGNIFARGLPSRDDLQRRPIARILSKVLCEDSIVESDPITEEDATALKSANVTAKVGSMPTTTATRKKHIIFLHRHSIGCSWNGGCRTPFPQFHLNQAVFFSLRSKLSVGSLHVRSPPNEESVPDASNDHRRLNTKTNFTVIVTPAQKDRSLPFLNTVRRKDALISTYPLKNGVWNFCVTVMSLRSTRVDFPKRGRM